MNKGGYKIIDFKDVSLTSTRVEINGVKEALEDNYGKVVLLTNVVLNNVEMDDCFSTVIVKNDESIKLNCYDGFISINDSGVKYSSASVETLDEDVSNIMGNAIMKTSTSTITGDLNDAVSGWAYYGGSSTNLPASSAPCFVLTLIHQSFKCQLAITRTTGIIFTRVYSVDSWGEWKQATNL